MIARSFPAVFRVARMIVFVCMGFAAFAVHAENFDVYPFDKPDDELRFEHLTQELRCPKCQNQSIADSNAPIARDLRQRTYELMKEGRSDDEIVAYLEQRYGEFISYRPHLSATTLLLWIGPFLLLFVVLGAFFRFRAAQPKIAPADPDKVKAILAQHRDEASP